MFKLAYSNSSSRNVLVPIEAVSPHVLFSICYTSLLICSSPTLEARIWPCGFSSGTELISPVAFNFVQHLIFLLLFYVVLF